MIRVRMYSLLTTWVLFVIISLLIAWYLGIYGGFARSCYAVTDDNNTHLVTDENGCATDTSIFGQWEMEPENRVLAVSFNAFKFPASDNIRFQCNIRVCFGRCQPVMVITHTN